MIELSPQEVIQWYNSQGIKDATLASETGLSPATISNVKHGKPLSQKSMLAFYKLVDGYKDTTGDDVQLKTPLKASSTSTPRVPRSNNSPRKESEESYSSSSSIGGFIVNALIIGGTLLYAFIKTKAEMAYNKQK